MDDYYTLETDTFKLRTTSCIFDLDGTLIVTKSKRKFPKDENDWIFNKDIINRIIDLANYSSIIIITNQLKANDLWYNKMKHIISILEFPVKVYIIQKYNIYRKPFPTLLNMLKDKTDILFYCGDMETDYKFAHNANIKFIYINEFLGLDETIKLSYPITFTHKHKKIKIEKNKHELIILIGFPGSGKSTYANLFPKKEYIRINNDEQKTGSMNEYLKALKQNKCIIIDNLNNKISSRTKFIDKAKKYNYYIRCIVIKTSMEKAIHNMYYRMYKYNGIYIPIIVYRKYLKDFEPPTEDEGFNEIKEIDLPEPDDEDYYLMFF